jgi:hypothetical protein
MAREAPYAPADAEALPIVERGAILVYRIYDVADQIDLAAAEARLFALAPPRRLRFARVLPRHIQLSNPPVAVGLGTVAIAIRGTTVAAEVSARVYDYGAVSIQLSVPMAGWRWSRLEEAALGLSDDPGVEEAATRMLETLLVTLGDAVIGPHRWDFTEDYTIYFVSALSPRLSAADLLERVDLAPLLLAEGSPGRLGELEREYATKHRFSYYEDDLTVIDWNAAFVYEPSDERDVPDVLEHATSQLLELRYYDDLLDRELDRIYDRVAMSTRAWNPLFPNRNQKLARHLTSLVVELTEITERIENSLKVIDDLYLAKVYHAAVERFRIPRWQASVQRKLAIVQSVHQLVQTRITAGRSLLLEATIVVLILLEIVLAVLKVK